MKQFKGKAIYNPSGKAGEYSYWACNFYNGCSAKCDYCYNRKGVAAKTLGADMPTLKKSLQDEQTALIIFKDELLQNLDELQKNGLFFNFVSDPFLDETVWLNQRAIYICHENNVPVKVLTKQTKWEDNFILDKKINKNLIVCGFTLTGHDELESGASTNQERIEAMKKLHEAGFKTFASIEPIIDLKSSLSMIFKTTEFCDLYKVGLLSGKKFDWRELRGFMISCTSMKNKFYFKDSFVKQAGLDRANLTGNCVGRDYNIFRS